MSGMRGIKTTRGSSVRNTLRADILASRSTDDEASALLDELANLQSWCVMQMGHAPDAMAAADLVQRTRILIIERCKRPSNLEHPND